VSMCYPADTDWSCAFTDADLEEMKQDPAKAAAMRRSEALAWYTLASLCAYRIGVCPTVVRPCAAGCSVGSVTWMSAVATGDSVGALPLMTIGSSFTPHISGGNWINACGCSAGDCSCTALDEVILPGPVGDIQWVKIDGETIDPSRYRVDNGDRLVSLDPTLVWPSCQDMAASDSEEGSFAVSYYRGSAPNELTRFAAGVLAAEYYKACMKKSCRLPAGVTQVARGGVTYEIQTGLFPNGATGIAEVDAVIRIYNPHTLKSPPRVLSPDRSRTPRRSTWVHG
jgi:hypothetical protein